MDHENQGLSPTVSQSGEPQEVVLRLRSRPSRPSWSATCSRHRCRTRPKNGPAADKTKETERKVITYFLLLYVSSSSSYLVASGTVGRRVVVGVRRT